MSEDTKIPLHRQHCLADSQLSALTPAASHTLLEQLDGWQINGEGQLYKPLRFDNYYQTTAFINAVVWLAHRHDHHPEICFGYRDAQLILSTHAVSGLSVNDFILAAHIDRLSQV